MQTHSTHRPSTPTSYARPDHYALRPKDTWLWIAFCALVVLHHDFWFWDSQSLVLGFIPVGLFYHVMFSVAASLLWLSAVKFAWPAHIESWAESAADERGNTPDGEIH